MNEGQQLVTRARVVAVAAHYGQLDKAGQPYVEAHVADVAARVAHMGPQVEAVAWLHDVVEDTEVSEAELRRRFPAEVVDGVMAMTKRKGEPRDDYYARVKANPLALAVKVHGDIPSNTDPARVAVMEQQDPARAARFAEKYAHAREMLA